MRSGHVWALVALLCFSTAFAAIDDDEGDMGASSASVKEEPMTASDPAADMIECASVSVFNTSATLPPHRWYDRATKQFMDRPVPQLYCVGEHCDAERRPEAVHCNLVERRLNSRSSPVPIVELRWQCEVVRPAWLSDVVQFHGLEVDCASTIDGTRLRVPSAASVLDGHRRLTTRLTTLRREDFVDEAHSGGGVHDPMPNHLLVARDPKEWNPLCAHRVALRKVSLHDFMLMRASVTGDAERVATQALQGDGGAARPATAAYLHDTLVAAEVCRIKFSVRLIYKTSAIISVLCLAVAVVGVFSTLIFGICSSYSKKNRDEVARAQARRAFKKYEEEVLRRRDSTAEPAFVAPSTAALADAPGYFGAGLEGLTPDEIMLRAERMQRHNALQVPRNVSASQYIRNRSGGRSGQREGRREGSAIAAGNDLTTAATVVAANSFCIDEIIGY